MLTRFKPSEIISPFALIISLAWGSTYLFSKETALAFLNDYSSFLIPLMVLLFGIEIGSYWRGAYEDWMKFVDSFAMVSIDVENHPIRIWQQRKKYLMIWTLLLFVKAVWLVLGLSFAALFLYFITHESFKWWWLVIAIPLYLILVLWPLLVLRQLIEGTSGDHFLAKINKQLKHATDFTQVIDIKNKHLNNIKNTFT
jgi:hypothetical protein